MTWTCWVLFHSFVDNLIMRPLDKDLQTFCDFLYCDLATGNYYGACLRSYRVRAALVKLKGMRSSSFVALFQIVFTSAKPDSEQPDYQTIIINCKMIGGRQCGYLNLGNIYLYEIQKLSQSEKSKNLHRRLCLLFQDW
jgi:hypothetical protein